MPNDLTHAIIQVPLATLLACLFFREAFSMSDRACSSWRIWMTVIMGALTGGFVSWRIGVVLEAVPPEYRVDGGQAAQTMLLVVIGIAYLLLREPRRKT